VEWADYYQATDWLTLDADLPSRENGIPNSVGNVITGGATVQLSSGFWSTLRHFGNVPLNELGTAYLRTTTPLNFGMGWQQDNFKLSLDLFNLFDSKANDIAYFRPIARAPRR
jgi:hypothetical protein